MQQKKKSSSKHSPTKGKKGGKAQKEFYTHIGNVKRNTFIRKKK